MSLPRTRPGYTKTIVCLANSRKYSGRCIAGKEILPESFGHWVRPVSQRLTAELSEEERRDPEGREPGLLDILEIPLLRPAPMLYQTENHVVSANPWRIAGALHPQDLWSLLDHPAALWPGGSSRNGVNDRVSRAQAEKFDASLYLIRPERLTICVRMEDEILPHRRVRAHFRYAGVTYLWAVTDVSAERAFLRKGVGDYPLADTVICVSLGEPFEDGYCYKLVASLTGIS